MKEDSSTIKRIMSEMGRRGGKTAAANMTPEQRLARARKASKAAAAKRRAKKGTK